MPTHLRRRICCIGTLIGGASVFAGAIAQESTVGWHRRMDRLEAEIVLAEDMSAIKRLHRAYGFYLDKGMWSDLADLFAEDAIARYPAGTFVGQESIRKHLHLNVGGVDLGENGLGDDRLYNHMTFQPVVHIDQGGQTARGRWRVLANFGSPGGAAVWAEGAYEMIYARRRGTWQIESLTYQSGFSAPYATGWVDSGQTAAGRPPRTLRHPADEPRGEVCGGYPQACIGPFHYENPSVGNAGAAWHSLEAVPRSAATTRAAQVRRNAASAAGADESVRQRAQDLARRTAVLRAEQRIENLQRIYGYYVDRRDWDHVADLFAEDATLEIGLRGVYEGREHIRRFLEVLGPDGLRPGDLNDHAQLQIIVDVAPDGLSARSRSREWNMTGTYGGSGAWSEGVFTNTFVNDGGVWKFASLRYYPTFITDYDAGWAQDAQAPAGPSREVPPDRRPTQTYEIYPSAHIPPYHYDNPVTGTAPRYPTGAGRPSARELERIAEPVALPADRIAVAAMLEHAPVRSDTSERSRSVQALDSLLADIEHTVFIVKDHHEIENLKNIYGFYLDKNLWNDLADLFAEDGSMELAQRGRYIGRERVRQFLFNVFGEEGPVAGRLGNHIQMQPVIHFSADGQSAQIRSRMLQQLNFGPRASMGAAVYEDEVVRENGVWKFSKVHAYNTWGAAYDGGWMHAPSSRVPGPSSTYPPDEPPTLRFSMFPDIYELPFHYDNPVSGRPGNSQTLERQMSNRSFDGYMPPEIAAQLRAIGPEIAPPETSAIYAPLHAVTPNAGIRVVRDRSYGRHARNVLDVFTAAGAGEARPVVVFVHGGGFQRGAKTLSGSPFYDNVMYWAAGQGYVGVNVNYRLAPESVWPSGIEDLGAVLAWIDDNIAEFGGDAGRVILWGHSAGAAHVADYLAERARAGRDDRVAAAILVSGFYDLGTEVSAWASYYGDDVSQYARRSSLPGLLESNTPLLVVDAELDPANFQAQARLLTQTFEAAGKSLRRLHLARHSHISESYAVGTSDRSLTDPIRDFIDATQSDD